jgi:hypothetical protein
MGLVFTYLNLAILISNHFDKRKGGSKMRNEMYHAFRVGFNWWYVVLPLLMLILGVVGSFRFYEDLYGKIRRKNKKFTLLLKVLAIVADIIVIVMILAESFTGIFQIFLNNLTAQDDPLWALIILVFAIIALAFIGYRLMILSINLGGKAKLAFLKRNKFPG